MHPEDSEPLSWSQAGDTYYAVLGGRMVALLYYTEGDVGENGGPGGDMVTMPPAWMFVMADDPYDHFEVDAPTMTPEMTGRQLAGNNDYALGAATQVVQAELARRRDDR